MQPLAELTSTKSCNSPLQYAAQNLHPFHRNQIKTSLVESRERRARLTLKDIGQRKRRAAIAASSSSTSSSSSSQRGGAYHPTFGQGQRDRGGDGRGRGLLARAVWLVTAINIPGLSTSSGSGGASSSFSPQQAVAEVS